MVTIEEAREEVEAARQEAEREAARIQAVRLSAPTRAELARQTREDILRRQQQEAELEKAKAEELKVIKEYQEQVISPYGQEVSKAEAERAAYEEQVRAYGEEMREWSFAQKIAGKEKLPSWFYQLPKSVQAKIKKLRVEPVKPTKKEVTLFDVLPKPTFLESKLGKEYITKLAATQKTYIPKPTLTERARGIMEPLREKFPILKKLKEVGVKTDIWFKKTFPSGAELPYGLQPKQEYIYGEKFSPFYAHIFLGRKIAEKIPYPEKYKKFAERVAPITEFLWPTVAELPKVAFFSIAMKTATAAEVEEEASLKFRKKRLRGELELEKKPYVREAGVGPYIEAMKKYYNEGGVPKLQAWFRKLMQIYKQQKTAIGKETAQKNIELLLQKAYEKGYIEFATTNYNKGLITLTPPPTPMVITSKGGVIPKPKLEFIVPKTPEIPLVKLYGATTQIYKPAKEIKLFQPSKVGLESWVIPKTKQIQKLGTKEISMALLAQAPISVSKQISKLKQRQLQLQKQVQLQVTKQVSITKQMQRQRQVSKQEQILKPKLIIPFIWLPKGKEVIPTGKEIKLLKKVAKAYQVLIKRRGKYKAIPGVYPKPLAIKKGEEIARTTLAASFKVTPTNIGITAVPEEYLPSPRIFRGYKIIKGKRIPLKEEWIQFARYRLATRGEVGEIMRAKRKAKTKLKWL